MKKENHQANIVRITDIREHTNADNLELIILGEYQVVSKKGQFKLGDLGVYLQPDSVVPQTEPFRFLWQEHIGLDGTVPERKRRITVRRFRKEWSEGLLLPVTDFTNEFIIGPYGEVNQHYPAVGDDVSDILGITHYEADEASTRGETGKAPRLKKKYPKSLRGWYNFITRKIKNFFGIGDKLDGASDNISLGIPVYDVDSYKAKPATFVEGEPVKITEKVHGSNARFIYLDGVQYAGSRKLWKSENSTCAFRRALKDIPWIGEWCKAHPGYVLWGELTPTQKGYEYGSKDLQFFVFDVYTPEGNWLDESTPEGTQILSELQPHSVPCFYKGPYQGYEHVRTFVDGPSTVPNAKNIREGVVVATTNERHERGGNRTQRKVVSLEFLERDNK